MSEPRQRARASHDVPANDARPPAANDVGDRDATPLDGQIDLFLRWLSAERRSPPRTVETYARPLRELAAFVVEKGLPPDARRLGLTALRAYLASIYDGHAPATLARKVSTLRAFYRFLLRRGHVTENPAATLRAPKVPRGLPRFLTVDEAFRVVEAPADDEAREDALRLRDAAVLELLYGAGLRVSELAGLCLGDVDLGALRACVLGKGRKERLAPFGQKARDALVAYLAARPILASRGDDAGDALLVGARGTRLTVRQIQNVVRRYGALGAGRGDLHPHALRHTYATHLLDAGADPRAIQEMLGHASLATTQRYTHVTVDRLMAVYDKAHPLAKREG